MKTSKQSIFFLFLNALLASFFIGCKHPTDIKSKEQKLELVNKDPLTYKLPIPNLKGKLSLEETLNNRRSRRSFRKSKLSPENISQLLWAANGITKLAPNEPNIKGGYRTTPSAGVIYPLRIYLLISNVSEIEEGVFAYNPVGQIIGRTINKNIKKELAEAALNQKMIAVAPACIVICAETNGMIETFGDTMGRKYIYMEAGHSAQNIYLQAEALHLGTCSVGSFEDNEVRKLLKLSEDEEPLYIMPIGYYHGE